MGLGAADRKGTEASGHLEPVPAAPAACVPRRSAAGAGPGLAARLTTREGGLCQWPTEALARPRAHQIASRAGAASDRRASFPVGCARRGGAGSGAEGEVGRAGSGTEARRRAARRAFPAGEGPPSPGRRGKALRAEPPGEGRGDGEGRGRSRGRAPAVWGAAVTRGDVDGATTAAHGPEGRT